MDISCKIQTVVLLPKKLPLTSSIWTPVWTRLHSRQPTTQNTFTQHNNYIVKPCTHWRL